MIVVTGAAGFIGSCLVSQLNRDGYQDLMLADDFSHEDKQKNLSEKSFSAMIHRDELEAWLENHADSVEAIFHIGARTDTAEQDQEIFDRLNVAYSKMLWSHATKYDIPLLYASSAATYGDGSLGFDDDPERISQLRPMNPYGQSKQDVDEWVLQQQESPTKWLGLKFFNVYGPNEYHKGRMASVIFHAFPQVKTLGTLKLFRSHKEAYGDGLQKRDFIYVRDVVEIMSKWLNEEIVPGIYNLGTGTARTFLDLGTAVFEALGRPRRIEFIDIPEDIREAYQYFTEANMNRFREAGLAHEFRSLEEGIREYVTEYLKPGKYF